MNDAARATIFRNPAAETPEKWVLLKDAVTGVRSDFQATNIDKIGHPGKWAVRYPNGDQPHNEADLTFMVNARSMTLALMCKVEALVKAGAERAAKDASTIVKLTADNKELTDQITAHVQTIQDMGNTLDAKEKCLTELSAEIVRLTAEIPKAEETPEGDACKVAMILPRKRTKRPTKAEAQRPDAVEATIETPEGVLNA